mmetsp:Transcript_35913/g.58043  ORF Transcript_35913/g.58043 Transcript_35913/m.58043 type:complete len:105 (+) Transcript_35913:222-536(+)
MSFSLVNCIYVSPLDEHCCHLFLLLWYPSCLCFISNQWDWGTEGTLREYLFLALTAQAHASSTVYSPRAGGDAVSSLRIPGEIAHCQKASNTTDLEKGRIEFAD